ncbi:carbohydrate-binding protein [Paenibacillus hexagrammi]|uniref:Probable pectate lyase C n=1 Tax=Paenibacillus hexagrammi TaxID=2908839 RepID=A0ABY3SE87_9BACL|nr:carbohydrate-binding protein [Paenibacillus sp. YPD9-1]UJF31723.1 carbohydrate-binding protein [Paenibacillus sp. YPD9-1]
MTANEANEYTVQNIFQGTDAWDPTLFGTLPRGAQPPAAPTELSISYQNGATASLGDTPLRLLWNIVPGASSYNVYRSSSPDGGYSQIASGLQSEVTTPVTTVEAENYNAMDGVKLETTSDVGGGQDVGYIDAGDWMDYAVDMPADGFYTIKLRVSAPDSGKQLQVKSSDGTVLGTVDVPLTGGWQNWDTVNAIVALQAGPQTLRVSSVTGKFNLNWIEIDQGLEGKVKFTDTVVNTGTPYSYTVTAVNENGESAFSSAASLSSAEVSFDRNMLNQANIQVSVQIQGEAVTSITNGSYTLVQDKDFSIADPMFTINKSYLKQLPLGTNTLVFTFDSGRTIPFEIQVSNTSILPSQTISNVMPLHLYTFEGIAPYLPSIVPVTYTDTSEKALPVVWNSVSPASYASAGNFTVQGTIKGMDIVVDADVTVQTKSSVNYATGGDDLQSYVTGLPFDMPNMTLYTFPDKDFNIVDYGAVGDGVTKNTSAINQAIIAASANPGGGRVIVPAGVWYTGPIVMQNNVNLHLEDGATILFSSDLDDFLQVNGPIRHQLNASGVTNIAVTGNGVFDGNGQYWRPVKKSKVTTTQWNYLLSMGGVLSEDESMWYPSEQAVDVARPILLNIADSKNVLVDGPTFMNGPVYAGSFTRVQNLVIRNTTANNDWWFQNGDGLDVTSSQNVVMYHNTVNAGDDDIGMKASGDPSSIQTQTNVVVANNIVFRGHGGVSFGSNTSGGFKNLAFLNNQYIGTDTGINIKSYVGGGGPIENLYFDGIHMDNILGSAISFSDFYTGHNDTVDNAQLGVDKRVPELKQISISNITVNGADQAVTIDALQNVPVHDIVFTNVKMTSNTGWVSNNIADVQLNHVQIVPATGVIYDMSNASNVWFNHVDVPTGTSTFLRLTGNYANNIILQNTEYANARFPWQLGTGISPAAIVIPEVITIPQAPAHLTAITGASQVYLSWNAVAGADQYVVKRSLTSGTDYQTVASNVTSNAFYESGMVEGTYYYVVTAVNSAGESIPSDEASVNIQAPSETVPLAVISGGTTALVDREFELVYGLNHDSMTSNANTPVVRQSFTMTYDPEQIHFVSAESLVDGLALTSIENDQTAGKVTFIMTSGTAGVVPHGDMMRIKWNAVGLEHPGDSKTILRLKEMEIQDVHGTISMVADTIHSMDVLIDKAALSSQISSSDSLASESYTTSSWALLQSYLTSAKEIQSNLLATQAQVNAAVSNLQAARARLEFQPSKSVLGSNMESAQTVLDASSIGVRWGQYPQAAHDTLAAAIAKAAEVFNRAGADGTEVSQAAQEVNSAREDFLAAMNSVASVGDLGIISAHNGVDSTDSSWSEIQRYDINHDNRIDIIDLAAIAQKF